ncbi:hypothetical protein B0H13DRAFT_1886676 [Mycena leptocephala]|nr:hypothetical protein B0H13DRAFT_1886676 [Mycena leptocephala]
MIAISYTLKAQSSTPACLIQNARRNFERVPLAALTDNLSTINTTERDSALNMDTFSVMIHSHLSDPICGSVPIYRLTTRRRQFYTTSEWERRDFFPTWDTPTSDRWICAAGDGSSMRLTSAGIIRITRMPISEPQCAVRIARDLPDIEDVDQKESPY